MVHILLLVLISFLIVDSIISFYIVKDIDKCKNDLFCNIETYFRRQRAENFDSIRRLLDIKEATRRKRRKRKSEVKETKDTHIIFEDTKPKKTRKKNNETDNEGSK